MINFTLRQLEIFHAIARKGHMTQAANTIGLTQSAASMALSELESLLGKALFERKGKTLRLTRFGQSFLQKADTLLLQAKQMQYDHSKPQSISGTLLLAASSTIGNYVLPPAILAFKTHYPAVQVNLVVTNTQHVITGLSAWSFDLGFIEGPAKKCDLKSTVWQHDKLALFCRADHPLTQKKQVNIRDCFKYPWIEREAGSGTLNIIQQALSNFTAPAPYLTLGSSEAIKSAVSRSNAISILSSHVIQDAVEHNQLCILNVSDLKIQREFCYVQSLQRSEPQLTQLFLKSLSKLK